MGSNKLLGKKVSREESSETAESDDGTEEEYLEGAHYYSTRPQLEEPESDESQENEEEEGTDSSVASEEEKPAVSEVSAAVSKYVPPHLRKTDDKLVKLRRLLQGLINKLSETNIESILADIDQMYAEHSRNSTPLPFAANPARCDYHRDRPDPSLHLGTLESPG